MRKILILLIAGLFILGCQENEHTLEETSQASKGKLFIIGGGSRPPELIQALINASGIDSSGYAVVLPMASSIPDTSAYYGKKQFTKHGIQKVYPMQFADSIDFIPARIDSVRHAQLIYITGGDQTKFMEAVAGTALFEALHQAYDSGATIAGTSAGAAIMSKKMITGNEYKHPVYTGEFTTIEADNMEISEGMGFIDEVIIDQHFIKRMRMNRLITVSLEHPGALCIGIDESTAILVNRGKAKVYGVGQVVTIQHNGDITQVANGLLGGEDLTLSIYLPEASFPLP